MKLPPHGPLDSGARLTAGLRAGLPSPSALVIYSAYDAFRKTVFPEVLFRRPVDSGVGGDDVEMRMAEGSLSDGETFNFPFCESRGFMLYSGYG